MIDIRTMIESNENFCKHLGWTPTPVKDAIKVMKMYRSIRGTTRNYDIAQFTKVEIDNILDGLEEEYFPSMITQNFKVQIQGKDDEALHKTRQSIKDVWGVKEVVQSEKDC